MIELLSASCDIVSIFELVEMHEVSTGANSPTSCDIIVLAVSKLLEDGLVLKLKMEYSHGFLGNEGS